MASAVWMIGKVILVVAGAAIMAGIAFTLLIVLWLAYEQANGRNPFQ